MYGYRAGRLGSSCPLGGRWQRCFIAGIWRDYARSTGAIVIARADYIAATGDRSAQPRPRCGSRPGLITARRAGRAARAALELHSGAALEIMSSGACVPTRC